LHSCYIVVDFDCEQEENIYCEQPAKHQCPTCHEWVCDIHFDSKAGVCKLDSAAQLCDELWKEVHHP